ncbi:MAG: hypothetical protein ACXWUD_07775 [Methylosarcina sp.]
MRKLVAGFILIMTLPLAVKAQASTDAPRPETAPAQSTEAPPPGAIPGESPEAGSVPEESPEPGAIPGESPQGGGGATAAGTESDAYNICLRATRLFEQQEKAKGKDETAEAPISASCESKEQKPASYWQCMEKQAMEKVDFNTAHWRCGKQTKVVK